MLYKWLKLFSLVIFIFIKILKWILSFLKYNCPMSLKLRPRVMSIVKLLFIRTKSKIIMLDFLFKILYLLSQFKMAHNKLFVPIR